MKKPFFSIILPTKNRPGFLPDAIKSVLLQDFEDYELIVSDNFNDERTRQAIEEFMGDSRLVYIRPREELNIPDHWEFAGRKAKGNYVLMLTDRAFFRKGALRDIYDTLEKSGSPEVVFWKYGYFDEKRGVLESEKEEGGFRVLDSTELIKNFGWTLDAHFLPRPHVGCYREDIVGKIRREMGGLYLPYAPDFTSSLLVLAYAKNTVLIPRPLVFFQGASVSAGTRAQSSVTAYLDSLNISEPYKYVPIKAPINGSLIFNDFFKIRDIAGRNFHRVPVDWVFYFGKCYQELKEKKMIWKVDEKTLAGFWHKWREALSSFDKETKAAVKRSIFKIWYGVFKSYLRETPPGRILLRAKRALAGRPNFSYSSALEAAGFSKL